MAAKNATIPNFIGCLFLSAQFENPLSKTLWLGRFHLRDNPLKKLSPTCKWVGILSGWARFLRQKFLNKVFPPRGMGDQFLTNGTKDHKYHSTKAVLSKYAKKTEAFFFLFFLYLASRGLKIVNEVLVGNRFDYQGWCKRFLGLSGKYPITSLIEPFVFQWGKLFFIDSQLSMESYSNL